MKKVLVHLNNGNRDLIECKDYYIEDEKYIFILEKKNIEYLCRDVSSIDDPFKLPNGKVIPKDRL